MSENTVVDWFEIGRMEDVARADSPVHRLDPRAKAIVTLVFVLVVMSFPPYEISALTPLFLYPVALLSVGRIPGRDIARKLIVAAPFACFVGIFNPLVHREPMIHVGSVIITAGWVSFISIMLRFTLTVSAALLLIASTGMYPLAAGLARLGVPRVFVVQILFLYRYLFVLCTETVKVLRGVRLRTSRSTRLPLSVYGSLVGHLLLRSLTRAENIHRAMLARGFSGEIRTRNRFAFGPADWVYVCVCIALFMVMRHWDIPQLLGGALMGWRR